MIGEDYNLALGINFDYTSLVYANRILEDLMSSRSDLQSALWQEGDSRQLADLFERCLATFSKPAEALNKKERMRLVAMLEQRNAFSYRKSVPYVAKHLGVSPVYRLQVLGGNYRPSGDGVTLRLPSLFPVFPCFLS